MEISDKHGARVDDAMSDEARPLTQGAPLEPRVEGHREMHGSGDDQPIVDARLNGGRDQDGDALGRDEAEARSEIAKAIDGHTFPGRKEDLIASARGNNAPAHVLEELQQLPDGEEFENVQAIWTALGGREEHRF